MGAVVVRVGENSPAAKAGVTTGDVITKLNGQQVKDAYDMMKAISLLPIGQVIDQCYFWRRRQVLHPGR